MTMTTALCISFLCAGMCAGAQDGAPVVVACDLKAISAAERPRYNELTKRLRGAVQDRIEVQEGYRFELTEKSITLVEVAEWMSMERLCCPFLTLQLAASGAQPHWSLKLTGPDGVKALLRAEFRVR